MSGVESLAITVQIIDEYGNVVVTIVVQEEVIEEPEEPDIVLEVVKAAGIAMGVFIAIGGVGFVLFD